MMLPRLYGKTIKNLVILLLLGLLISYSIFRYLDIDLRQPVLEYQGFKFYRRTHFNPRDTTLDVYRHINNKESQLTAANDSGLNFHWDDWVDLNALKKTLKKYRKKYPDGSCDKLLRRFGNVDSYKLETLEKKILRGMVDMYCLKELPTQVLAPTVDGYVAVPVLDKKRVGYQDHPAVFNASKEDVLREFHRVDYASMPPSLQFHSTYKEFDKEIPLLLEDFLFDPDLEILKLHSRPSLSEDDSKYLQMLEYGNSVADTLQQYFKYPYIIGDVFPGHFHHVLYPYFKRMASDRERQSVIQHLIRGWFKFAQLNGIPSWINYGSLLGWAYNGVTMPWDSDIDVQIPIQYFDRLARQLNGSLVLEDPRLGNGKFYFIVSPTYVRQGNGKNFIDGRFIDVDSLFYIDITLLSHTNFTPKKKFLQDYKTQEERNKLVPINCKHWNWHSIQEISPIRHTYFEGSSIYVPHNVTRILSRKYGADSITTKLQYHNHNYQSDISMWVPDEICMKLPNLDSSRFTDDLTKSELTLAGACNSVALQDEYKIIQEYLARHHYINVELDNPKEYNIKEVGEMPLYRKDTWDYHRDIVTGKLKDFNWYHRQFEDDEQDSIHNSYGGSSWWN